MRIFGKQIPLVYLIPVVVIVVGLFLVRRNLNQDKWDILMSRDYGYKIEYPANWVGEVIRSGRGSKYLHGQVNDNYLLPRSYLLIHSEPMENPTFKDGAIWGEGIIQRDCGYICWEGLQPQRVGVGNYLALTTTYQEKVRLGQTLYKKAVIIVADDGVYMLQFSTYSRSQEVEDVFTHMLDSFEIIERDK